MYTFKFFLPSWNKNQFIGQKAYTEHKRVSREKKSHSQGYIYTWLLIDSHCILLVVLTNKFQTISVFHVREIMQGKLEDVSDSINLIFQKKIIYKKKRNNVKTAG